MIFYSAVGLSWIVGFPSRSPRDDRIGKIIELRSTTALHFFSRLNLKVQIEVHVMAIIYIFRFSVYKLGLRCYHTPNKSTRNRSHPPAHRPPPRPISSPVAQLSGLGLLRLVVAASDGDSRLINLKVSTASIGSGLTCCATLRQQLPPSQCDVEVRACVASAVGVLTCLLQR